jgi:hypothetical protein
MDNALQIMRGQSNKSNIGSGSSNERPLLAESGPSISPFFHDLNDRYREKRTLAIGRQKSA